MTRTIKEFRFPTQRHFVALGIPDGWTPLPMRFDGSDPKRPQTAILPVLCDDSQEEEREIITMFRAGEPVPEDSSYLPLGTSPDGVCFLLKLPEEPDLGALEQRRYGRPTEESVEIDYDSRDRR